MDCTDGALEEVSQNVECSFNNVPVEVLEFILSLIPPYRDLQNCMCVCKRWYSCCKNVLRKTENDLYKAIIDVNINWTTITPLDMAPSITKRFSHAACVHDNSMYIFGGCTTNSTAFNDLWRFDLSKRQWIRPLAMGTYPTPKAYATMIPYKDSLILFGGWAYPLLSHVCQDWTVYSDIHFYDTNLNRWVLVTPINSPPPMAGHSAIIRGDTMVVFGGLYKSSAIYSPTLSSNEVWVLDINTMVWVNQTTSEPKPPARYGQSLVKLNENHIMIIGGIKGAIVYEDCWILKMEGSVWIWYEVNVKNKEWSISNIWCNPACRVGDKVIFLSHERKGSTYPVPSPWRISSEFEEYTVARQLEQNMRRLVDKDNNINGRRGTFSHHRQNNANSSNRNANAGSSRTGHEEPRAGPSNSNISKLKETNANLPDDNSNGDQKENIRLYREKIEKQFKDSHNVNPNQSSVLGQKVYRKIVPTLHIRDPNLAKMAAFSTDSPVHYLINDNHFASQRRNFNERHQAIKNAIVSQQAVPAVKKSRRNTLALHMLDISTVLNENCFSSVSWIQPQKDTETEGAPEGIMMYSLVRGNGELIMFGGLYCMISNKFSNSLHFITPPKDII